MKLKGNIILITGGSTGIGLALATRFVELGNTVVITGRDQAKLAEARKKLPTVDTYVCDVTDPAAIENLSREVEAKYPTLNVLINNAGIFTPKNITTRAKDLKTLTAEIDINFSGTVRTTSAFIDTIVKNKGTIMNVSSGLAFVPLMVGPIYCATKAAIHSYTISLRQQLSDLGVEVIELAPPAVKTNLTTDMPSDGDFKIISTDELVDATIRGIKAGQTLICPGQSNQLRLMSRLAPSFIQTQLAKGSKSMLKRAPN